MDRELQLRLDLPSQCSRMNLGILGLSPLDKTHDLRGQLVRALRAALTRQQSCEPLSIERRFSLIERWTRQTEKCGGLSFGDAILTHMTQHLIFNLHQILRIPCMRGALEEITVERVVLFFEQLRQPGGGIGGHVHTQRRRRGRRLMSQDVRRKLAGHCDESVNPMNAWQPTAPKRGAGRAAGTYRTCGLWCRVSRLAIRRNGVRQ